MILLVFTASCILPIIYAYIYNYLYNDIAEACICGFVIFFFGIVISGILIIIGTIISAFFDKKLSEYNLEREYVKFESDTLIRRYASSVSANSVSAAIYDTHSYNYNSQLSAHDAAAKSFTILSKMKYSDIKKIEYNEKKFMLYIYGMAEVTEYNYKQDRKRGTSTVDTVIAIPVYMENFEKIKSNLIELTKLDIESI